MNHQAIYALNPTVVTIRGDVAYDANNNIVTYDVEAVQAYANSKMYITHRQQAYPAITDQLDMLWHAMNNNEIPKANTFFTAIQTVKDAHPKS